MKKAQEAKRHKKQSLFTCLIDCEIFLCDFYFSKMHLSYHAPFHISFLFLKSPKLIFSIN